MTVRVVAMPEGPAAVISGGDAARVAALLGQVLEAHPTDLAAQALAPLRRLLLEAGQKSVSPKPVDRVASLQWITPNEAATRTGRTVQAITKRCRLGQLPGAHQDGGRWLIPADAIEGPSDAA